MALAALAQSKLHDHYIPFRVQSKTNNIYEDFVWIVLFSLVLLSCCTEERGEIIGYSCSEEESPSNSTYLFNRRKLFTDLERKIADNFSSAFSQYGNRGTERIFGFVQCHGLSGDPCYYCILRVKDFILQMCADAENAYMWLDGCFLRYGKKNMTSVVDNSRSLNCRGKYSGPQLQTFDAVVNMTLGKLNSSTNGNKLAVVAGRLNSRKNGTTRGDFAAYGKAQCYLYLSQTVCGRCIENSKIYAQNSSESQNCSALQIWSESCFLKYWVSYPNPRAAVNSPPGRNGSLDGNEGNLPYPLTAPSGSPTNPVPVHPVSTGTLVVSLRS